ncbi:MAG: hypothetical protein HQL53_00930 [Magnetococcales bacterium]|nr:hypothetical protein [Magnetococcales bacterium]
MMGLHLFEWLDELSERDPIIYVVVDLLLAIAVGLGFSALLAQVIAWTRLYPGA